MLASENDHLPYDPFGDDDIVMTSSVPVVPVTRTITAAAPLAAAATSATVSTVHILSMSN